MHPGRAHTHTHTQKNTYIFQRGLLVKLEQRFAQDLSICNYYYYRYTHALVFAIQAIVIAIADPLLLDAGSTVAAEHAQWTFPAYCAVALVAAIAAVVVAIAEPTLLDAVSVAAGEFIGAAGGI